MVRIEYVENPTPSKERIWYEEIEDVSLSVDPMFVYITYSVSDKEKSGYRTWSRIGYQETIAGNILYTNLIIGDERYSDTRIRRNPALIRSLLENERVESQLQEL